MKLAIATVPLTALFGITLGSAGPVWAAEGDLWGVDRQNVNVRAGPSTSTEILMTINPGERIVEIASKGEWFFAEFPNHNKRGWIFAPLLIAPGAASTAATAAAPAAPTPAPEPEGESTVVAVAPVPEPTAATSTTTADIQPTAQSETVTQTATVSIDQEPAAVKSFRDTVSELNDRAVSVAGIELFNDVRSTGGGGVQVLATETWANVPEAGQSSYMNALFERWQSVANGLGPLSLQIVDPSGEVMMERTGS